MQFLFNNKEWIFSGIGVFIIGMILALFKRNQKSGQYQTGGDNSTNIQSGRDTKL